MRRAVLSNVRCRVNRSKGNLISTAFAPVPVRATPKGRHDRSSDTFPSAKLGPGHGARKWRTIHLGSTETIEYYRSTLCEGSKVVFFEVHCGCCLCCCASTIRPGSSPGQCRPFSKPFDGCSSTGGRCLTLHEAELQALPKFDARLVQQAGLVSERSNVPACTSNREHRISMNERQHL